MIDRNSCARCRESPVERGTASSDQLARRRRDVADWYRDARVGVEPVEFCGHIELDQIPLPEAALSRDPVDGFVVDADAVDAGKAVVELGS
jgi:hypothetical protein